MLLGRGPLTTTYCGIICVLDHSGICSSVVNELALLLLQSFEAEILKVSNRAVKNASFFVMFIVVLFYFI